MQQADSNVSNGGDSNMDPVWILWGLTEAMSNKRLPYSKYKEKEVVGGRAREVGAEEGEEAWYCENEYLGFYSISGTLGIRIAL